MIKGNEVSITSRLVESSHSTNSFVDEKYLVDGSNASVRTGENALFRIILISALLVLCARLLAPFEVGTDQSIQLEAANRLASGLGLTTTNDANHLSRDISVPPEPGFVVQWPPGFTLLIAAFLVFGVPLIASLKLVYAVTTMVGWLGWGTLFAELAVSPLSIGSRSLKVHYLLAVVLPILTTPSWRGTDIFLWAGVPIFVLLLWRGSLKQTSFTPFLLAGLLFGALCGMRYVSSFLAVAAALILFQVSYPNIKLFAKRFLVFLLPSLLIGVSLVGYVNLASHNASGNLPAKLTASSSVLPRLRQRVDAVLQSAPITSNLIVGFPLIEQATFGINSRLLNYAVGVTCLLVLLCLPLLIKKSVGSKAKSGAASLALSLSFLPFSLTLFLVILRLLSDSALFRIRRYYEPLLLCGVFVFYVIATKAVGSRALRTLATLVVILFTAYTLLFNAALLFIPERRYQLIRSVLAFTPARTEFQHSTSQEIRYPSWTLYSWKENSKEEMKRLYRNHPEALFFVQDYPAYIFDGPKDGPVPGRTLLDYPGNNFLSEAYTSKPLKVFWVVASPTKLDFIEDSQLKLVYSDPVERTSIYESDLAAGYRFIPKP